MTPKQLKDVVSQHAKWLAGTGGERANMTGTDLSHANLRGANMRGANLTGTDLTGANMRGADLRHAITRDCIGGPIYRLDVDEWSVCVTPVWTSIGCQNHPNETWLAWTPDSREICKMHAEASDWWRQHGDAIKALICSAMSAAVLDANAKWEGSQ